MSVGVLPVEFDVLVSGVDLLGDVHLDALVSCENDPCGAVELEQLGEDKAGRASAEHENFDADWGIELVETMNGACSGFEKSGLLVGEVVDLVKFMLRAKKCEITAFFRARRRKEDLLDDIVGETTIGADTTCLEILAHESLTTSAVEAVIALYMYCAPNVVSVCSKAEETRT